MNKNPTVCAAALLACAVTSLWAAEPPTVVRVGTEEVRPASAVPPLGANDFGTSGAMNWAVNNFIPNPGNEPAIIQGMQRVRAVRPDGSLVLDGGNTDYFNTRFDGFLSGASVRIYRLANKEGKPIAPNSDGNLDAKQATQLIKVGTATIAPKGTPGLQQGGWVVNEYAELRFSNKISSRNNSFTDHRVENGTAYWYVVRAVGANDEMSGFSAEVTATPTAGADGKPAILMLSEDDKAPNLWSGNYEQQLEVVGGSAPLTWSPAPGSKLPDGWQIDPTTGVLTGWVPDSWSGPASLRLRVTDSKNRSDERTLVLNAPAAQAPTGKPGVPDGVKAVARDGSVTISWNPVPGALKYFVLRSKVPKAEQANRVVLAAGAPKIEVGDYLFYKKQFGEENLMAYVHPRVRGMGNPYDQPEIAWRTDFRKNKLDIVPHPEPIPADFADPGRGCLRVKAAEGPQSLRQFFFISPGKGGEARWYGHLDEGKTYHVEFWMRQEGLKDGTVRFSVSDKWPDINTTWSVVGTWKRYEYTFTAPAQPEDSLHYGPTVEFSGPGTLWLDNARFRKIENPEEARPAYVPDRRTIDELVASQPATGPKGAHRIWFLQKDATMDGLTSWHCNSRWNPDWWTNVDAAAVMTLPMGMEFELRTGNAPGNRMRPWLVLQHLVHSEEDWRGLIEYLAAPYDPAKDSPKTKPWAAKRHAQRGHGRPWTDEFSQISLQFGNETWHQSTFPDWIGFHWSGNVFQGGREYGLAMEYLSREVQKSPYWNPEKFRLIIDGGYIDNKPGKDGTINGYGPLAMEASTLPQDLTQANYVGPKWETGDKAQDNFSDKGLQEYLLGWLMEGKPRAEEIREAQMLLASRGRHYTLSAYEGGPSGFALPGHDSGDSLITSERYGKSLASGVAALDAWLGSYLYGWSDQCYLAFAGGSKWASHSDQHMGRLPNPGWLAMTMRNRFASGGMVRTTIEGSPTIARGGNNLPLIAAYTMRDGNRTCVFVISRRVDKYPDPAGNGYTPVVLDLPFTAAKKITLHTLTGDPRANNFERMDVDIKSREIPVKNFSQHFAINAARGIDARGLPPASAFLYVFEDAVYPPRPKDAAAQITVDGAPGNVTEQPSVRFRILFDRVVPPFSADQLALKAPEGARASVSWPADAGGTIAEVLVDNIEAPGPVSFTLPENAGRTPDGKPITSPVVTYRLPAPTHKVLAGDSFDYADEAAFWAAPKGNGWAGPWMLNTGEHKEHAGGFVPSTAMPMNYPGLASTPGYLSAGVQYMLAWREPDLSGALASFRLPNSDPAQLGQRGRTLWVAALLRKETDDNEPLTLGLNAGDFYQEERAMVRCGWNAEMGQQQKVWSLQVRDAENAGWLTIPTAAAVKAGKPSLLVMEIHFAAKTVINLHVNPPLGTTAPAKPAATATLAGKQAQTFRRVVLTGGKPRTVAFDELRIGDSFQAVAPKR